MPVHLFDIPLYTRLVVFKHFAARLQRFRVLLLSVTKSRICLIDMAVFFRQQSGRSNPDQRPILPNAAFSCV
jgi:hypothetical protein